MPLRYDATAKFLLSPEFVVDWLPLCSRKVNGPVELISADLSTVTRSADRAFLIKEDPPWIWHLEAESTGTPRMDIRLNLYNSLFEVATSEIVWSTIIAFSERADSKFLTGCLERGFPGEPEYRVFRYQVIRVWELSPDMLLAGGAGLAPLVPISKIDPKYIADLVKKTERRIEEAAAQENVDQLRTATRILMGLKYPEDLIAKLIPRSPTMRESVIYQEILEEGREEGAMKELRDTIVRLGAKRFQEQISNENSKILSKIDNLDRLHYLTERLLEVSSWDELLDIP